MIERMYWCCRLTSNEHECVEYNLEQFLPTVDCKLEYYRQLKDGHIPMWREGKVVGEKRNLHKVADWLDKNWVIRERNPHKVQQEKSR